MTTSFKRLKDGPVRTEAMRIARALVKVELKRLRIKVSHVESSEITRCAKELLAAEPDIIKEARKALRARIKVVKP